MMKDQIITPKAKFDRMESDIKKLTEFKEQNKIELSLTLQVKGEHYKTSSGNIPFRDFRFYYSIDRGAEFLPEKLSVEMKGVLSLVDKYREELNKDRIELYAILAEIKGLKDKEVKYELL